jgi:hypothetical protein
MNSPANLPFHDETLRSPALSALTSYLVASGWNMEDQDSRTSVWRPGGDHENDLRLVLPVRQAVTDYEDLVYDALRLLAYLERRSLEEVGSDIVYGAADTVAIRLTPDAPSGQAPLSLAHEAVSALRSYVIGSGAALYDRSLVLPARRARQAEIYAGNARLSTQPGSFVLSLTLPLSNDDSRAEETGDPEEPAERAIAETQAELLRVPPQPFGRRVTNRMATVARFAQNLADEVSAGNQKLPVFSQAHDAAPNATELESLSNLGGADGSPYQMRFAQSPLATQRLNSITLRITPGQQRVMADAAEYLRTKQSRANVTVEGSVVNLSRIRNSGPGEIVVFGIVDDSGKARRFHAELTEADYNEAIRAHLQGLRVVIRGDLDTRGTWKWIRPLRAFAIIPGLDYDDS